MLKFIMRNKLQFLAVIGSNLILYWLLIVAIAYTTNTLNDLESILGGILFAYLAVISFREYDKKYRPRITLFLLIFLLGSRYISTFWLDPSEVITIKGIVIGFLVYVYIWNTADTIHNIRVKSRLVLTDLDKK